MSRVLEFLRTRLHSDANPTNGSWWFVQVPPTKLRHLHCGNPINGSWWMPSSFTFLSKISPSRLDLNYPPTAVGGIESLARVFGVGLTIVMMFSIAMAQEKKISRAQLPAAVEQTVTKESEGATIKGFAMEVEHGQTFYEASLTVNGHGKDILIDKDGNVVEVEEEVPLDTLPAAVQDALKKAAGAGRIQMVESLTKNGTLVAYEAHLKRGYKRSEIQVGPNGEKLKRPE